jgi:hypothetical protein
MHFRHALHGTVHKMNSEPRHQLLTCTLIYSTSMQNADFSFHSFLNNFMSWS